MRKMPKKNRIKFNPDGDYVKKYQLGQKGAEKTNKISENIMNPTVQPDGRTEQGVAVPDKTNVEYSKEYGEENKL